jgi:hypothetical protein
MLFKPIKELKHTGFGCALQTSIIHILHTEAHRRAQRPLEIIEDSPRTYYVSNTRTLPITLREVKEEEQGGSKHTIPTPPSR